MPPYEGNLRSLSELIKKTRGTRDAWRLYKNYTYSYKNNDYYRGYNIKHCGADDTYCFGVMMK